MIGRLLSFAAASALVWLVVALPARAAWGDETALTSAAAMAICMLPALVTLAWVQWSWGRPIETQFTAALGGTGIRLFAVAIITILLDQSVPFLREHGLISWVALFYMLTLALEVGLILWAWPRTTPAHAPERASRATAPEGTSSSRVD